MNTAIVYRLELYNRYERISPESRKERFAGNGWYVAQVVNGCRSMRQWDFKGDEQAARDFLSKMNREVATHSPRPPRGSIPTC